MFKAPIQLLNSCHSLDSHINDDLQLDILYDDMLGKCEKKSEVRKMWETNFTTDTKFLKDSQKLAENFNMTSSYEDIKNIINEIKGNPSFREKYEYITVEMFESLNSNPHMLQLISMFSLTSPLFSLLTPFIMLIIPFFILKVRGSSIKISTYLSELKKVLSMLPIGKLFDFKNIPMDQRGFVLFSVILYFVQIYQNSLTCYRFYRNSKKMVDELHKIGNYFNKTALDMKHFKEICNDKKLTSYDPFVDILDEKIIYLDEIGQKFLLIQENVFKDMGIKMKYYYDLYKDTKLEELLNYTFEFQEYTNNISSFSSMKELKKCSFSKKNTALYDSYHGSLRNNTITPIKNSVNISEKSIILSGPNASGKTTLLKSVAINLILSQQLGRGFYDKAKINPFHSFHCYINIPDTCDRDSLFQAEARRCKNILNTITKDFNHRHLCLFDELFSGTNPSEAVASAIGYLEYLNKNPHVRFILTTHFLQLCGHFNNTKCVENFTFKTKFNLSLGITKIKGGIKVLEDLNFPVEILKTAKKNVS